MPSHRPLLLALLVSALVLPVGTAHAAAPPESGWYLGASAGQTRLSYPSGSDVDTDGYSLYGGYRFGRHFALEAAYAELGDDGAVFNCPVGNLCIPEQYPVTFNTEFRRADLAAIGILPVGERFDLFAKLGYSQGRYASTVTQGMLGTTRQSEDSSETVYGVGGRLHFTAPWSLRLQWDRSKVSGVEVDGVWLGVEYRFGG